MADYPAVCLEISQSVATSIKSDMVTQWFMAVDLFYRRCRLCVTCVHAQMLKSLPCFHFIHFKSPDYRRNLKQPSS